MLTSKGAKSGGIEQVRVLCPTSIRATPAEILNEYEDGQRSIRHQRNIQRIILIARQETARTFMQKCHSEESKGLHSSR